MQIKNAVKNAVVVEIATDDPLQRAFSVSYWDDIAQVRQNMRVVCKCVEVTEKPNARPQNMLTAKIDLIPIELAIRKTKITSLDISDVEAAVKKILQFQDTKITFYDPLFKIN